VTGSSPAFPPQDLSSFLDLCGGRWMGLRSRFTSVPIAAGDDDDWHSSERGEMTVTVLASESPGSLGGLEVTPPDGAATRLAFEADGTLQGGEGRVGRWQLWPDGSLELVLEFEQGELRERIWFTKPNLRLRSSVLHAADGSAGGATFCSEIRRVSGAA
jgi:hypothetical protein